MKNHHAHQNGAQSKKVLKLAIAATAVIFIVELIGGLWTNSLALLSDVAHVLMDLLSFIITYFAIVIAERPISDTKTFGWHRVEVFAALTNALTVFFMAFLIFLKAFYRFRVPEQILSTPMIIIASAGLLVNIFVIWKLHPHLGKDVNVRSAYLHALGDALASVAVVVSGGLVIFTGNHLIDPLGAMFVALIILVSAYKIFSDSIQILLEGVPKGLDRGLMIRSIEQISGEKSVKDLHVWNICSHLCALSVHVTLPPLKMNRQKEVLQKISSELREKFDIVHSTIQIESEDWEIPKIN